MYYNRCGSSRSNYVLFSSHIKFHLHFPLYSKGDSLNFSIQTFNISFIFLSKHNNSFHTNRYDVKNWKQCTIHVKHAFWVYHFNNMIWFWSWFHIQLVDILQRNIIEEMNLQTSKMANNCPKNVIMYWIILSVSFFNCHWSFPPKT
jgi:hypothetical protein